MSTIFTKALSALVYEDLKGFLATREPEGLRVEYKSDFPPKNEDLAKSIAAMANSDGGILMIGVPTDRENRPKDPTGIMSEGNIPDRIANICAAKIRPVIAPDVRIFDLQGSPGKCLALLRVPASQLAPHYLPDYAGHPLIPIRIDGRITQADVPTVDALLQRRRGETAAAKRKAGRRDPPSARLAFEHKSGKTLLEEEAFQIRLFVFAIHGPERLATFTDDFDEFLRDSLPYECPFATMDFDVKTGRPESVSGFDIRRTQNDTTFTCTGLEGDTKPVSIVVRVADTGAIQFGSIIPRNDFRFARLVRLIRETLVFARTFFSRVGYSGDLEFELMLENVSPSGGVGATLILHDGTTANYLSGQHVQIKETFSAFDLDQTVGAIIKSIIRKVLREGNIRVSEEFLDMVST
jgi:hypothetical protein